MQDGLRQEILENYLSENSFYKDALAEETFWSVKEEASIDLVSKDYLSILPDDLLVSELKALAEKERRITLKILDYLYEVERRRIYTNKYSSLHEFCMEELKYSSGAAHRRIESMRVLKDVPESKNKIISGELNVSVLSQVGVFVKHQKKTNQIQYTKEEKKTLVDSLCGKSVRQVQKKLVEIAPSFAPKLQEKVTILAEEKTALQIIADKELMELLEEAKAYSGDPTEDYATLLKRMAKEYLRKKTTLLRKPAAKAPTVQTAAPGRRAQTEPVAARSDVSKTPTPGLNIVDSALQRQTAENKGETVDKQAEISAKTRDNAHAQGHTKSYTRYIQKNVQIQVRARAGNQCEHVDRDTGRRCQARQGLQIDHKIPHARGGENSLGNLQLLCNSHNKCKAVEDYGAQSMQKYLPWLK